MWAYESVFYQIFPLGMCGAPQVNDGVCVPRVRHVADWADYLHNLGIGAVLLNPVFESGTHGYDTCDLRRVDCRLGTNEDLAYVVRALHDRGIRVVLDAVFNHVGRGFWAFEDLKAHGWDARYREWFITNFDGDSPYGDGFWYEGWEGHYELVKLNLANPEVADYLLDCVRFWREAFDIDGLRLDVAYSLDRGFMGRLRGLADELGAQGGPGREFVLIGETLHGDYSQLVQDGMLHSCTNYECYKGLYSSFNSHNLFEIAHSLHRQFGSDPWCIYRGLHLLSFADNHDVTRLASILADPGHIPCAYGVLFGMPGIPCLYYGSEWGMEGVKGAGSDWSLRPALDMPERTDLTAFIERLIAARTARDPQTGALAPAAAALAYGGYRNVVIASEQLLFERALDGVRVLVAVNASREPARIEAAELAGVFTDLLDGDAPVELTGALELPPYGVRYLQVRS